MVPVVLQGLFWCAYTVVGLGVAYLLTLTGAAILAHGRPAGKGSAEARFAILVPAHNEEPVLAGLLESLRALEYPSDRCALFVAADNCGDRTAEVARAGGARVFERHDPDGRGKGHALQWLLEQVATTGEAFDAFLFLDADSRVAPDLLRVLEGELARGHRVLQASYLVLNPGEGTGAALRCAAMSLVNHLRPLGRNTLGFSAGLKGNGMCFAGDVIRTYGWPAHSLAEDAEFGARLLLDGIRVQFVPQARVWAQMPPEVRESESQNLRWEAGRLLVLRKWAPALLRAGLKRRNPALLEAAIDLALPPLSLLAGGTALLGVAAVAFPQFAAARPAVMLLAGGLGLHVLAGLLMVRAPAVVWRSLLCAPAYCLWKVALYARVLARRGPTSWVRTHRFPG